MSRSWDTPNYWARYEADEILREMPDGEPASLADELECSTANYDDGTEMAALIAAELRRRAAAGVRFWPSLQTPVESVSAVDIGELIDDDIPW